MVLGMRMGGAGSDAEVSFGGSEEPPKLMVTMLKSTARTLFTRIFN